jgi:DtxR family transcriptional regulator, Mn-dependent transcriptional regulator
MQTNTRIDEALEAIWTSTEAGEPTVARVGRDAVGGASPDLLRSIQSLGLITIDGDGDGARIEMTDKGREIGRRVIRGHRLAERLVCDVLGVSLEVAEAAACEFEHTLSHDLTDSICTLLGHPSRCPHGKAIPEGECCRQARSQVGPVIAPASTMEIGEEGRVAYVALADHSLSHQLASLGIAPGVPLRMHQRWPSFVIKCEETEVAIEEAIAKSIFVRRNP